MYHSNADVSRRRYSQPHLLLCRCANTAPWSSRAGRYQAPIPPLRHSRRAPTAASHRYQPAQLTSPLFPSCACRCHVSLFSRYRRHTDAVTSSSRAHAVMHRDHRSEVAAQHRRHHVEAEAPRVRLEERVRVYWASQRDLIGCALPRASEGIRA